MICVTLCDEGLANRAQGQRGIGGWMADTMEDVRGVGRGEEEEEQDGWMTQV